MASNSMKSTPYAQVYGISDNGYSKGRTSKVMYMNEKLLPQAMVLSKNIQLATRYVIQFIDLCDLLEEHYSIHKVIAYFLVYRYQLFSDKYASENFQIMNYGPGGKISGHADSTGGSTEELIDQGGRGMQCNNICNNLFS